MAQQMQHNKLKLCKIYKQNYFKILHKIILHCTTCCMACTIISFGINNIK